MSFKNQNVYEYLIQEETHPLTHEPSEAIVIEFPDVIQSSDCQADQIEVSSSTYKSEHHKPEFQEYLKQKAKKIGATITKQPKNFDTNDLELLQELKSRSHCKGGNLEIFYPERGASTKPAEEICGCCKLKDQCGEFAIVNNEKFGIWGGLSERQRRIIRKQRRMQNKSETS